MKKDDDFLAEIKKGLDAERDADNGNVTPERAEYLQKRYPVDGSDTPAAYKKIKPEEFFDGN